MGVCIWNDGKKVIIEKNEAGSNQNKPCNIS